MKVGLRSLFFSFVVLFFVVSLGACKGCSKEAPTTSQSGDAASPPAIVDAAPIAPAAPSGTWRPEGPNPSHPGQEVQKACYALARGRCTKLSSCMSPAAFEIEHGTVASCLSRFTRRCLFELAPKESTITIPEIAKCDKALSAAACPDVRRDRVTGCEPKAGTLADGRPCLFDAQCATRFCLRDANEPLGCGRCQPIPKEGAACTTATAIGCGRELTCIDNKCAKRRGKGQPCASVNDCTSELVCLGGTCADPKKAGDACENNASCASDEPMYCDGETKACKVYDRAEIGEECGPGAPTKKCRADASCEANRCLALLREGVCMESGGARCDLPTKCIGGRCEVPLLASCKE